MSLHRNEITLKYIKNRFALLSEDRKRMVNFSDRVIIFSYEQKPGTVCVLIIPVQDVWRHIAAKLSLSCTQDDRWPVASILQSRIVWRGADESNPCNVQDQYKHDCYLSAIYPRCRRYTRHRSAGGNQTATAAAHNRMMGLLMPGK